MNSSKTFLISLTLVAGLFANTTMAQYAAGQKQTPAEKARIWTERMTQELSLTTEQVPQVQTINVKYVDELRALKQQPATEKGAKRTSMQQLMERRNAELKAVLNPTQYEQLLKNEQAKAQEQKAKRQQRKQQAPPAK